MPLTESQRDWLASIEKRGHLEGGEGGQLKALMRYHDPDAFDMLRIEKALELDRRSTGAA